jgi:hypothetical protein
MSFDLSHDDNPKLSQGVTVILTLAELDHIDNALTRVVMNAENKMGEIQTKNRLNPERQSEARTERALDRWDRVRVRAQNIIDHLDAAIEANEAINAS